MRVILRFLFLIAFINPLSPTSLIGTSSARADGPANYVSPSSIISGPSAAVPAMQCKVFKVDVDRDVTIETTDQTTPVGEWLHKKSVTGWRLQSMDFEVGQKATGYPQGWLYLCVSKFL